MKNCKNCIWFDKCGSTTPCEYYEADDSASREDIENYGRNLALRASAYEELVDEQDA